MRYLFIFLIVTQVSCKKDIDPEPVLLVEAASFLNTSYGSGPQKIMDISLTENRNDNITKTIVVIHGGSWTGGDKTEMTPVINSLQKRLPLYAIINLNYRLAYNNSVNVFPAQEDDIKSAIEFYLSKSKEYKVSKDLILVGASAGAHPALLHSYKNDPGKHVKTVVDFFGPTNLVAAWNDGSLNQLILFGAIG